ncbi:hypothetical protein AB0F03_36355 [Streptomyces sp. NPDC028722]|uniref:hypothetical protein n=1 Tax=unclassified Streptomyces TaxID=2593676 RepID=UPI0033E717D0
MSQRLVGHGIEALGDLLANPGRSVGGRTALETAFEIGDVTHEREPLLEEFRQLLKAAKR